LEGRGVSSGVKRAFPRELRKIIKVYSEMLLLSLYLQKRKWWMWTNEF